MTTAENAIPSPATRRTALTWLARVGFAARGLIYLIVGGFAAAAALGLGKEPHGIMDAVQAITGTQLRLVLAASTGIGLACLAAYFATVGMWHCCRGRGPRRWLMAAGMLGDAIVYGAVMLCIVSLLFDWHADGEQQVQLWTAWALGKPFGRVVIGFIGLLILACGLGVTGWVLTTDIDDDVDLPEDQKRVIEPIGRYGLSGRGLGAALVGVYWLSAALHTDPSQAHELGGALQSVQEHSKGWLLLLPLAGAFAASAVFDFVQALFHRPDPGLDIPGCSDTQAKHSP
jgi:hypothetical protein